MDEYEYVLLDWIDIDKLNWSELSKNPNAIHLLEKNQDKIDWINLSCNPNAIHLLEKNQDKINWNNLLLHNSNPNVFHLFANNIENSNMFFDHTCDKNINILINISIHYPQKFNKYQVSNRLYSKLSSSPSIFRKINKNNDILSSNKKVESTNELLLKKVEEFELRLLKYESTNESLLKKIEELETRLTKYELPKEELPKEELPKEEPDILEFVYMKLIDNLLKNKYKSHEIYSEYKILDKIKTDNILLQNYLTEDKIDYINKLLINT